MAGKLVYTDTENADSLYGSRAAMPSASTAWAATTTSTAPATISSVLPVLTKDRTLSPSDFTSGSDVIHVIGSNFGLVPGVGVALLAGATTPSASSAAPQFLYNTTTGALYFDQDGVESAHGAVQIATLTGQKNLVASDIVVAEM